MLKEFKKISLLVGVSMGLMTTICVAEAACPSAAAIEEQLKRSRAYGEFEGYALDEFSKSAHFSGSSFEGGPHWKKVPYNDLKNVKVKALPGSSAQKDECDYELGGPDKHLTLKPLAHWGT